jgi:hypothetical protein
MVDTLHINTVELRARIGSQSLYRITASDGQRFATRDMVKAALCERAMKSGVPVRIHHQGGWNYREITFVELAEQEVAL